MHHRPNHPAGFTFPELLIALGIFALGFVTVGAIFPTAIMLQKRTVQALEAEKLGKNAKAMLQAMPWDKADLDADIDFGPDTTEVRLLDDTRWDNWPLASRALLSDQFSAPAEAETFWVPLLWDSDADPANTDWTAFVFTLRRSPTVQNYEAPFSAPDWTIANPNGSDPNDPVNIPKVVRRNNLTGSGTGFTLTNAERWLDVGDPVLISTGETGNVTEIVGDAVTVDIVGLNGTIAVWFAPKPSANQASPGREILTVTGVAR
jgi:prepilin-type N-terminal cleavage/methylation domain-containing protein